MFPVGDDDIRGAGPAYLTIGLIIINVIVWIFEFTMAPDVARDFINQYGVVPAQILAGNQLYSLFTSMFLHGGWLHVGSNMLFLWIFGDNVEVVLGHAGFIVFYLLGGLGASLAHIALNPQSTVPSVGASGALAAVMGAYVVMFPRSRVRLLIISWLGPIITRVTAIIFLGIWFVIQLFTGVASLGVQTAQTGGVAVWAHVGGFIFGLLGGLVFRGRASGLELGEPEERRPDGPLHRA